MVICARIVEGVGGGEGSEKDAEFAVAFVSFCLCHNDETIDAVSCIL